MMLPANKGKSVTHILTFHHVTVYIAVVEITLIYCHNDASFQLLLSISWMASKLLLCTTDVLGYVAFGM